MSYAAMAEIARRRLTRLIAAEAERHLREMKFDCDLYARRIAAPYRMTKWDGNMDALVWTNDATHQLRVGPTVADVTALRGPANLQDWMMATYGSKVPIHVGADGSIGIGNTGITAQGGNGGVPGYPYGCTGRK